MSFCDRGRLWSFLDDKFFMNTGDNNHVYTKGLYIQDLAAITENDDDVSLTVEEDDDV